MAETKSNDWWERERQRFLKRIFVALVLILALIGYFSYVRSQGRIGFVHGVNFDTTNYIAFVRHQDDGSSTIYAVRADGSDLRALTNVSDPSNKEHPSWLPDGKSLVFSSNLKDLKTTQLYVLGDGSPIQLTYGSGNKFSPVVAPTGKYVAFITQGVVKTVTITGTDVTQLMPLPRSGSGPDNSGTSTYEEMIAPFIGAEFGPDGVTLAGIQDISNAGIRERTGEDDQHPSKVKLLAADQQVIVLPANAPTPLPPLVRGHEVSVAWEPNGTRLATSYTEETLRDADGNALDLNLKKLPANVPPLPISGIRIWTFNGPQPTPQNVLGCPGYGIQPKNIVWAPDNAAPGAPKTIRLAFEVWLLKSEGVRELAGIRVLDVKENGTLPDGTPRIEGVLTLPQEAATQPLLVAVGPDGKPQNPRWSPDGRRLLYEMVKPNGKRDLWTINADGTNPINLTKGVGDNTEGVWSPAHEK